MFVTHNERHGVYLASVLSIASVMAVVVLLPVVHQHFQRTMSMMLSNVRQCQDQSAKLWRQMASPEAHLSFGTELRKKRHGDGMALEENGNKHMGDVPRFKGSCCACTQGPPGLRGPPGRDGFNGKDGKAGTLGYPGRPGKYIPAPPIEQTSCQMCHPGPPGPPGLPGSKGLRGLAGEPGKAGRHGDNNHAGPPGPQGSRGEPGPPGTNGPVGDMGRLLNGAAPGRPGQMGPYGPRGTPGAPGKDGQPGMEGARGMRGPSGNRGDEGPQGPQGPSGMPGLPGDPGECGHCQKRVNVGSTAQSVAHNLAPLPVLTSSVPTNRYPNNPPAPNPIPPSNNQQQQQHHTPLPTTAFGQQQQNANGHVQQKLSKAYAASSHLSSSKSAQFGQYSDAASAPSIPLSMAPPGQEPSTIMPTVTASGKFVGYGTNTVGGYGAAARKASRKNEENVEYVDEVQQAILENGQKILFTNEASSSPVGKK